jgi:uncharacterized protein
MCRTKTAWPPFFAVNDGVVSAVHFASSDAKTLIEAVRASGVKRYLVVGGAGSLEVAPGKRLVDQPDFPAAYKAEALKGAEFLDLLRSEKELDWTFLSPSALFVEGERNGEFRLGTDALLTSDKGSSISFEDYAIALVNEIKSPRIHASDSPLGIETGPRKTKLRARPAALAVV